MRIDHEIKISVNVCNYTQTKMTNIETIFLAEPSSSPSSVTSTDCVMTGDSSDSEVSEFWSVGSKRLRSWIKYSRASVTGNRSSSTVASD